jgi:hypothetical protein
MRATMRRQEVAPMGRSNAIHAVQASRLAAAPTKQAGWLVEQTRVDVAPAAAGGDADAM